MATKVTKSIKKPQHLDLKKGREVILRVIDQNKAWIKEMADK